MNAPSPAPSIWSRVRWDRDRPLLTADDEFVCSLCLQVIPDGHVPLHLWDDPGVHMATFCGKCDVEIFREMKL